MPRHPATSLSTLIAVVAVAGCAVSPESADEQGGGAQSATVGTDCFTVSLARDFRYLDDRNLIVFAPAGQPYHLELSLVCMGLRGDVSIGLRSRTDRMCGFAGDAVLVDGAFAERCPVLRVTRLDQNALEVLIARFEGDGDAGDAVEVEIPAAED